MNAAIPAPPEFQQSLRTRLLEERHPLLLMKIGYRAGILRHEISYPRQKF